LNLNYNSITIPLLKNYLDRRLWQEYKSSNTNIIYQKETNEIKRQLKIPSNELLDDYANAIRYVLEDLSRIEQKELRLIYNDIIQPRKDIISLAVKSTNTAEGTIKLTDHNNW